jgi:hypothetical protein
MPVSLSNASASNFIPDRLFKAYGRWRYKNLKDGYILDSLDNKFSVSLSHGL